MKKKLKIKEIYAWFVSVFRLVRGEKDYFCFFHFFKKQTTKLK